MSNYLILYGIIVFAVPFGVSLLTLVRRWDDEPLHLFVSFGAGIFMGVVFLHLLPESLSAKSLASVPAMLLTGFLIIFFVERFILTQGDGGVEHGHKAISYTAMIGLTVHSVIEGFGLTMASGDDRYETLFFYSILSHKIPAAISLASLFLLARLSRKSVIGLLLAFSLATPVGGLIAYPLFQMQPDVSVSNFAALTTGSLIYIATGELLPEVFHTQAKRWLKLGLFLAGIIVIALIGVTGGGE